MSSDNRKQREQLKEEYKKHYRKMRDIKKRMRRTEQKQRITEALHDMDTSELMDTFDSFLFEVKNTVAHAEAKLDVALERLDPEGTSSISQQEQKSTRQTRAKETLQQVKYEMGNLYREIEEQAEALEVEKTVGKQKSH